MKRAVFIFIAMLSLVSCNTIPEREHKAKAVNEMSKFEGSYEGDFGGSGNIRITLLHVDERKANGYSLHKGLQRDMSGTVREDRGGHSFTLKEPGDNQYDGNFNFVIERSGTTLTGTWTPLNNNELKTISFTLQKIK